MLVIFQMSVKMKCSRLNITNHFNQGKEKQRQMVTDIDKTKRKTECFR